VYVTLALTSTSAVVEACLVDATGKVVHRERFALNRRTLELFATKVLRPSDHVALEATTNCWAVTDACVRMCEGTGLQSDGHQGHRPGQSEDRQGRRQVLAQLLRCNFLAEVWQPDQATASFAN